MAFKYNPLTKRANEPIVKVGSYGFPEPSAYKGNTATIVDSARNIHGQMVGQVIREDVGKVEMSWKFLPIEDWARINACFSRALGGKFINSVTFFEQSRGGWITRQMYVSDRDAEMFRRDSETGKIVGWTNCSLSLIEV